MVMHGCRYPSHTWARWGVEDSGEPLWVRTPILIEFSSLQTRHCITAPLSHVTLQYIPCPNLISNDENALGAIS
jgi:hypothetical protein